MLRKEKRTTYCLPGMILCMCVCIFVETQHDVTVISSSLLPVRKCPEGVD